MIADEMIGKKYGRWTVIGRAATTYRTDARILCRCSCGKLASRSASAINTGGSKSCGCLAREMMIHAVAEGKFGAVQKTHGHVSGNKWTGTYVSWAGMMARCRQKSHNRYYAYGARGIVVCDRWKLFANFLEDMGERPPGRSIDRINTDGNYEPSNCRWATRKEQALNRRPRTKPNKNVRLHDFRGEMLPLSKISDLSGVKIGTLYSRLKAGRPMIVCGDLVPVRLWEPKDVPSSD